MGPKIALNIQYQVLPQGLTNIWLLCYGTYHSCIMSLCEIYTYIIAGLLNWHWCNRINVSKAKIVSLNDMDKNDRYHKKYTVRIFLERTVHNICSDNKKPCHFNNNTYGACYWSK